MQYFNTYDHIILHEFYQITQSTVYSFPLPSQCIQNYNSYILI